MKSVSQTGISFVRSVSHQENDLAEGGQCSPAVSFEKLGKSPDEFLEDQPYLVIVDPVGVAFNLNGLFGHLRRELKQFEKYLEWATRRSHVTVPEHMPSCHLRHAEWAPARVLAQAEKLGPSVTAFCEAVMANLPNPEKGVRRFLGPPEVEAAWRGSLQAFVCCAQGRAPITIAWVPVMI